jgi:hypothetical protein
VVAGFVVAGFVVAGFVVAGVVIGGAAGAGVVVTGVVAAGAVAGVVAAGCVAGFVVAPDEPHADNPAATTRPRLTPRTFFPTIRRRSAISVPFSVTKPAHRASGVHTGDIAERMAEREKRSPTSFATKD